MPYWPLWYRVRGERALRARPGPDGPVDPSAARYDWDVSSWSLAAAEASSAPRDHGRAQAGTFGPVVDRFR